MRKFREIIILNSLPIILSSAAFALEYLIFSIEQQSMEN